MPDEPLVTQYPIACQEAVDIHFRAGMFPRTVYSICENYNASMKILFLHGWKSVPSGVKRKFLAQHHHEVINPKLPDENFAEAMKIAQAEFHKHHPDVIVRSSRGGAVAMSIDSAVTPLVLLCPAWKKFGTVKTAKANATILHSRADEVVPFGDSEELVLNSDLPSSALVEVGRITGWPTRSLSKRCSRRARGLASPAEPIKG